MVYVANASRNRRIFRSLRSLQMRRLRLALESNMGIYRQTLIIIIVSLLLASCDFKFGDEQAFKSTDEEYMKNFMALLEKRNIPYVYTDGYIRYKNEVKSHVEEIDELLSHTQSVQFKNVKVREYFRSLLDKEGIEYLALSKEGGSWTMWWPKSEAQGQAVELKAVEYVFDNNLHNEI